VKLREQSRIFSYRPLVSILTPTFNPNDEFLTGAIESVIAQAYENWELILVDDGSGDSSARALLKNLGRRDARIQIGVQEHGGISSALNTGLARARGDWIALLDHDDLLESDALFRAIELMQNDREADCDLFRRRQNRRWETGGATPETGLVAGIFSNARLPGTFRGHAARFGARRISQRV